MIDIKCYRINYELAAWEKVAEVNGFLSAPFGAILAVHALCNEVERLQQQIADMSEAATLNAELMDRPPADGPA